MACALYCFLPYNFLFTNYIPYWCCFNVYLRYIHGMHLWRRITHISFHHLSCSIGYDLCVLFIYLTCVILNALKCFCLSDTIVHYKINIGELYWRISCKVSSLIFKGIKVGAWVFKRAFVKDYISCQLHSCLLL